VKEFQSSPSEEFATFGNKCTLETIESTGIMLACLCPPVNDLETLYIPWLLSGMGGMGLNHSIYARCAGTCAACEEWGGKICKIAVVGIWKMT